VSDPLLQVVVEIGAHVAGDNQTGFGKQPSELGLRQSSDMGRVAKALNSIVQCSLFDVLTAEQIRHEDTAAGGGYAGHFSKHAFGSRKVMEGSTT